MKVLLHKITGEYGHYMGNGMFATSTLPHVFPETFDHDLFKKYVMEQEGCEAQLEDYEIKNIEINIID